MHNIEKLLPAEIERRSFEIIAAEAGDRLPADDRRDILLRAVHTTADFDYLDTMIFSEGAVARIRNAIASGAVIVTDTTMAMSGINKKRLSAFGGCAVCYIADPEVASEARLSGTTRSAASMSKAAADYPDGNVIFAAGNAPTALIRLYELIDAGFRPKGVIAAPVGFVNVVAAKEMITDICRRTDIPYIAAMGRKGGSNLAAAICNALIYGI